jgi:integrase
MDNRRLHVGKLTKGALSRLLKTPGRHSDGNGLYFRALGLDRAYWVFRYRIAGREREMSIGPYPEWTLDEAREEHAALRKRVVKDKVDVLAERRTGPATVPTFGAMADKYIAGQSVAWRNAKHLSQWQHGLSVHAKLLRDVAVSEVTTEMILKVLTPIWSSIPETASRLRARIAAVLDAAQALGHIDEDKRNPARWQGKLDKLLPDPAKLGDRHHHAAVDWKAMPEFVRTLRGAGGVAARALEFTILTASRSGETLGATYAEIDIEAATWTVPAARMKAGKTHVVPLGDVALQIVEAQRAALPAAWSEAQKAGAFVFRAPPPRQELPLSGMAMAMLMRRLELEETVHGFRSSFRDWAAEAGIDFDVAEGCLAHQVGSKVVRSYLRTTVLERRRDALARWSGFLEEKVVPLKKRVA